MVKYAEISPTMRRFIGGWENFRKIGFEADDLFCLIERSVKLKGALACFCQLKANDKTYEMYIYPGTQHGFHNNSTPRYNEAAAKLSWDRTIAFFKKQLA